MMLATISANTLLSSAMVTGAPNAVTSATIAYLEAAAESNRPEVTAPNRAGESSDSDRRVETIGVDHWGAEQNARFKELARNESLRELSIEELAEMESLTRLRRFATYPRSSDEILWQRRQRELTRGLVQALEDYVEFHKASRST